MSKTLKFIVFGALTVCYYLAYTGVLAHVIAYHEQHHLFLFSQAYFEQLVHTEGWLSYLTAFIIQFFYHATWGSALLALLIASVYPLTRTVIRLLTGKEDLMHLSVLPSMALFFHTMSADHSLNPVTGTLLGLIAACICLWALRRFNPLPALLQGIQVKSKALQRTLVVVPLICYSLYGGYHFVMNYNRSEGLMLKSEMYVKAKEWNKVLEYTGYYLQSGRTNQLISYFHHLALFHTGQLNERLFDYPQNLGVKALYFPWNSDSRESEYGHLLYEALGYINEAHRWEFEAMTVWGETAPHLLNLSRYNIAMGRPKVAQRFINKLKQSLFYRDKALELEKIKDTGEVPGLRNALKGIEAVPARFANVLNIGPELEYLCKNDPDNRMAFEYLMCNLLLSNQLLRFVNSLPYMRSFGDTALPRIYEEALFIYQLKAGKEALAQTGIVLSEETEKRFRRYYELTEKKQMRALQSEFGNTYWYYLNFISPYGNKVINQ